MVKDAEKNAAEDKKQREAIDARNRLDSMTYEVEKNVKEWATRSQPTPRRKSTRRSRRARGALRGDDMTEIRAAQES
jgi:molecular chaperone DnaK